MPGKNITTRQNVTVMKQSQSKKVNLELTSDEALVLFEFLSRYDEKDKLDIQDQAEQRILWNLLCLLEKQLVEPFLPDYGERLEQARNKIRDL